MSKQAAVANASFAAARVRDVWSAGANHPIGGLTGAGGGESNGLLCVAAGNVWAGSASTSNYAYDPVANTWTSKAAYPNGIVSENGGGSFQDKAVTAGGTLGGTDRDYNAWFDAVANTWTSKAAFSSGQRYPGIANLGDTYIESTGGYVGGYSSFHAIYDAVANSWTSKAANPSGNIYAGLCMGNVDSTAYAWQTGGFNGTGVPNNVYRWDRVANTWTYIGVTNRGSAGGTYGGRCLDASDGIGYDFGHAGLEEQVMEIDIDAPNEGVTKLYNPQLSVSGNTPTSARISGKIYVCAPSVASVKILTPRVTPRSIKRLLGLVASS